MSKILCLGSSGKDIFFPTAEGKIMETPDDLTSQKKIAFELGAKYQIKERYEALGGCAANVAVGLARLGVDTGVISTVGGDAMGSWIREELEKNGVGTEMLTTEKDRKSDLSAIVVDSLSADRVIFSNKNSAGNLAFDAERTKTNDWIFLGDIHGEWKEQMKAIIQFAQEQKKRIAFNPREAHIQEDPAEIIEAIASCEVVFLNKDEAIEIISNIHLGVSSEMMNDEKYLLEKIASLKPKIVVLTDGKRGAWVTDRRETFFAAGLEVPAVDSTGAGDSFLSGFLAAYIKEKALEECLKWGIANSASEVQFYGSIDGLLKEAEILEKIKEVKVKKN
jgi:ribokinase